MFSDWLSRTRELQRTAYGRDPRELRGEEKVEFIRWNVLAATRELYEALNLTQGWKPWDQVHRGDAAGEPKDRAELLEEYVDILHFIGNLLAAEGVSDTELTLAYRAKLRKNADRQATGRYGGDGKAHDAQVTVVNNFAPLPVDPHGPTGYIDRRKPGKFTKFIRKLGGRNK